MLFNPASLRELLHVLCENSLSDRLRQIQKKGDLFGFDQPLQTGFLDSALR